MAYNILIVDDSMPMRAVIKKVLKASGFSLGDLFEASNGEKALGVLDADWIDVVITDYHMPEMNGLELLKQMKSHDTMKDIPVVMVTSEGSDARVQEFLEQGAAAYVHKPFTPEQIRSKLNQILGDGAYGQADDAGSDDGLDF